MRVANAAGATQAKPAAGIPNPILKDGKLQRVLMYCPGCKRRDYFEIGPRARCHHCGYPDEIPTHVDAGVLRADGTFEEKAPRSLSGGALAGLVGLGIVRAAPIVLAMVLLGLFIAGTAVPDVGILPLWFQVYEWVIGIFLVLDLVAAVGSLVAAAQSYKRHRDGWWVYPLPGVVFGAVGDLTAVIMWMAYFRSHPVTKSGGSSFL